MWHIWLFVIGTIGCLTSTLLPVSSNYKVKITPVTVPVVGPRIVCQKMCMSCPSSGFNWSIPFCSNVPHHTEGKFHCLGNKRRCTWGGHESFDDCSIECSSRLVLYASVELQDVMKTDIVYEGYCYSGDLCTLPPTIKPPFYTLTPTLLGILIVSITIIITGICIDVYLATTSERYFGEVLVGFTGIWIVTAALTTLFVLTRNNN